MKRIVCHCAVAAIACLLIANGAAAQPLRPAVDFRTTALLNGDNWPADFNRDGITDLVGVSATNRVQVMLGNGDGTFRAPIVSATPAYLLGTADINGDGRVDVLATASPFHNEAFILPGNGDGTLAAPRPVPALAFAAFAVPADLDGDGRLDIAMGIFQPGNETVQVLRGNGDFTFADPVVVPTASYARSGFVVDVNGDGRKDLVVVFDADPPYLLLNQGSLRFTVSTLPLRQPRPTDVTARDVTGDGVVDLLISTRNSLFWDPPWVDGQVNVLRGEGDGRFTQIGEYPTGRGAHSIVVGDFTHDGILDVATSNHSYFYSERAGCGVRLQDADSVTILAGAGNGTFGQPTSFALSPQNDAPDSLRTELNQLNTSDVNRDGFPDLLPGFGRVLLTAGMRPNRPPTVFAGNDSTQFWPDIRLPAIASDPDGDFLDFQWTGGGPFGHFSAANTVVGCYETGEYGSYDFTVFVTDGYSVGSDSVTVRYPEPSATPPHVEITAPTDGARLDVGTPYTVRWTAADDDGLAGFTVSFRGPAGSAIISGCDRLPATARQCTWTSPGPAAADAAVVVQATDLTGAITFEEAHVSLVAAGLPAGWSSQDIGAVAAAGRASAAGTTFTISASGADIWGSADEFRFTYVSVQGNFDIVARVAAIQNVDPWTKAGVMVRENLTPGARHASLFATPGAAKGVAFQRRPVANGLSVSQAGPAIAPPVWLRLVRSGNEIRAYYRTGASGPWIASGVQVFDSLAASVFLGLAVTSHHDGAIATATFDNVSTAQQYFLPVDVGAVSQAGSGGPRGDVIALAGSGADIWGTADGFLFYERPWTGDGTITVRVTGIANTNAWAKAGVMFRESLSPGARQVMTIVSPSKGVAMQYRAATGGTSVNAALRAGGAPEWLRLTRSGNTFTGATSEDGVSWTTVGTATVSMAPTVFVGLPVTSHDNTTLTTATFEQLTVTR